jgi:protoporphyrinogen/coproporphyrinogen III oxidase
MSRLRPRIAVVGAGITGLVCAYRLTQLCPGAELTVFEATDRTGGKIRTSPMAGIPVDEAADAFLARVPYAVDLCRELGLADQLVTPAERRAFVYRHAQLNRFPEGLVLGVPTDLDALAASGLISDHGMARAAEDLTMPRDVPGAPGPGEDESVGDLVRRRIGDEIFDALVGPLLSGVNAGDADELSVEAGAPQFAAAVRDQPSLIAGLRRLQAAAGAAAAGAGDPDAPIFYGLRNGSGSLIDALVAHLPQGTVRTGSPVRSLRSVPDGFRLVIATHGTGAEEVVLADIVVLATPTYLSAPLVEPDRPGLAASLASLEWSSVVLATFVVRRSAIDHPLDGSGFLVSDGEGLLMTACSFGSTKWAHWQPPGDGRGRDGEGGDDGLVVLRVSAGRHHDQRAWSLDDAALTRALHDELATTIGLHGEASAVRISRWDRALPQYRPGHLDRARAWKAEAEQIPGLFLAGAGYLGLGVPACIADATQTASAVAMSLTARDMS